MLDFEIWPFQNRHLEPKGPVQVNGKSDKKCTFCAKFALIKKVDSITFSQFYICSNLARDLHIKVKRIGGHGSRFSRKMQNRPKNLIFVLLRAIVLQKRNNATALVRSPLAIDAYLDEKCSPREHLRSVRSV